MNKIKFLLTSRGIENTSLRIISVLKYYGVFPNKFKKNLKEYIKITKKFGLYPSFFITGSVLKKHYDMLATSNGQGTEIAMHGYVHIDYSHLSRKQQVEDLSKAMKSFNNDGILFEGFRCPYLRWNEDTMEIIGKLGFNWDSSESLVWDVVKREENNYPSWQSYKKLLNFCNCRDAFKYAVLPYFKNGFVEIPVSIPDDEALVDRLRITDKNKIGSIWGEILEKTYGRGEIFTLQLHPERIFLCDKALEMVLIQARQKNPPVWIAQLGEIAKWWKEKDKFEAKIHQKSKNVYQIGLSCSDRATILIKNLDIQNAANTPNALNALNQTNQLVPSSVEGINQTNEISQINEIDERWHGSYRVIYQKTFKVKCNYRPVIGVAPVSSPELMSFLKQDGYIIEVNNKKSDYGIYLEGITEFPPEKKLEIINKIENTDAPLVRFWRWPNQARSALSITGDIDAITIWDFILRLFGR